MQLRLASLVFEIVVEDHKVLAAPKFLKVGNALGFGVCKPQPMDDLFKN